MYFCRADFLFFWVFFQKPKFWLCCLKSEDKTERKNRKIEPEITWLRLKMALKSVKDKNSTYYLSKQWLYSIKNKFSRAVNPSVPLMTIIKIKSCCICETFFHYMGVTNIGVSSKTIRGFFHYLSWGSGVAKTSSSLLSPPLPSPPLPSQGFPLLYLKQNQQNNFILSKSHISS